MLRLGLAVFGFIRTIGIMGMTSIATSCVKRA
jgi:hypothetical protein